MFTCDTHDKNALTSLISQLACYIYAGDNVFVIGDSHVGKTFFIHELISHLCDEPATLSYTSTAKTGAVKYNLADNGCVNYYDFSNISDSHDIRYEQLTSNDYDINLFECADPICDGTVIPHISVSIVARKGEMCTISIEASAQYASRMKRFCYFIEFLQLHNIDDAICKNVAGDATARKYYRIIPNSKQISQTGLKNKPLANNLIVMSDETHLPSDYGTNPDSYIDLSKTTITSFCAIAKKLHNAGVTVPKIHAADITNMFLLLEDFGSNRFGADFFAQSDVESGYQSAMDMLLHLAELSYEKDIDMEFTTKNPRLTSTHSYTHQINRYSLDNYAEDLTVLLDWYYPEIHKHEASIFLRETFTDIWKPHLEALIKDKIVLSLRDFHSPNMFWLPEKKGIERIGVIDFQDAYYGHMAYDLVSLLMDARFDLPKEYHDKWLYDYVKKAARCIDNFNEEEFLLNYWRIGAQRNSRILGVFIRLLRRDNKDGYIKNIPRVWRYLMYCLSHPGLHDLKQWYELHLTKKSLAYIASIN